MEDEWEEEERLVVVELSGIINNDFLSKCRGTCKILDIDSEKPMMQVGQYVFAGEYEDTLGTCVLFEEKQQKGKSNIGPELQYMCHTMKKLTMQRIFVTDKKEVEEGTVTGGGDDEQQNTDCLSNQEENNNPQEVIEDNMDNTNVEDSAVG
ncbi:general transcription factor 3C polypeptide 6 [Melanotaenia boesemani]|uniref:general transcription factor 3C polypeptide 6 n=1 Tax=Melanotaenia boesemani TaxID=1250792 RepID=UPI001C05B19C|nr:general transcription factor 3C polypeptide 6 [Melanotaenia boesemani]